MMSDLPELSLTPIRAITPAISPVLFTAASDQSRGLSTQDQIDPLEGYDSTYHVNLAECVDLLGLRQMLYDHIRWTYKVASEFS